MGAVRSASGTVVRPRMGSVVNGFFEEYLEVSLGLEFWIEWSTTLVTVLLCVFLKAWLFIARRRAASGNRKATRTCILTVYEQILTITIWCFIARFIVLSTGLPNGAPKWYLGAIYAFDSTSDIVVMALQYWIYWASFETVTMTFTLSFLGYLPSESTVLRMTVWAIVYGAVSSFMTTTYFVGEGMQWTAITDVPLDAVFVWLQCVIIFGILVTHGTVHHVRPAYLPYAIYTLAWRTVYGVSLVAYCSQSVVGAVITVVKSVGVPVTILAAFADDTRYWRNVLRHAYKLAGEFFVGVEEVMVADGDGEEGGDGAAAAAAVGAGEGEGEGEGAGDGRPGSYHGLSSSGASDGRHRVDALSAAAPTDSAGSAGSAGTVGSLPVAGAMATLRTASGATQASASTGGARNGGRRVRRQACVAQLLPSDKVVINPHAQQEAESQREPLTQRSNSSSSARGQRQLSVQGGMMAGGAARSPSLELVSRPAVAALRSAPAHSGGATQRQGRGRAFTFDMHDVDAGQITFEELPAAEGAQVAAHGVAGREESGDEPFLRGPSRAGAPAGPQAVMHFVNHNPRAGPDGASRDPTSVSIPLAAPVGDVAGTYRGPRATMESYGTEGQAPAPQDSPPTRHKDTRLLDIIRRRRKDILIDAANIRFFDNERLAGAKETGSGAVVIRGQYKGRDVAIKVFPVDMAAIRQEHEKSWFIPDILQRARRVDKQVHTYLRGIIMEAKMNIAVAEHPYVVSSFGMSFRGVDSLCLVSDYYVNGTLHNVLMRARKFRDRGEDAWGRAGAAAGSIADDESSGSDDDAPAFASWASSVPGSLGGDAVVPVAGSMAQAAQGGAAHHGSSTAVGSTAAAASATPTHQLTIRRRMKMAIQAAKAVRYVHSIHAVHLDIKSLNLFVDGRMTPMLGDFGLSMFTNRSRASESNQVRGTDLWMAPELHLAKARPDAPPPYTEAVDIFAFGMLLFEIFNLSVPWPSAEDPFVPMHIAEVCRRIEAEDYVPFPELLDGEVASPTLVALYQDCLAKDPDSRPSMGLVVRRLCRAQDEVLVAIETKEDAWRRLYDGDRCDPELENDC